MTDDTLRELEREWQRSRTAEAHARWLLEKERRGRVSGAQVELAANLGCRGAILAVGREVSDTRAASLISELLESGKLQAARVRTAAALGVEPARECFPDEPSLDLLCEAGQLSAEARTVGSLAVARYACVTWTSTSNLSATITIALDAVQEWLDCSCEAHTRAVRTSHDLLDDCGREVASKVESGRWGSAELLAVDAAREAVAQALDLDEEPSLCSWAVETGEELEIERIAKEAIAYWALGLAPVDCLPCPRSDESAKPAESILAMAKRWLGLQG